VDESGDPTFYDRKGNLIVGQPGCSKILILGFVEFERPEEARSKIVTLQNEIVRDPLLQDIPSVKEKTSKAFHAKDDSPEVRYLFFKKLAEFEFRAQFIVARKIERVFRGSFEANEIRFYDHLVECLFQNVLHRYTDNRIYFSKRGSRDRQAPLKSAIQRSTQRFQNKWRPETATNFEVYAQTPVGEPCLAVVDYMNWAVMRAYTTEDMRYYRFVEDKVSLVVDLYDTAQYPNNWYTKKNPFDIKKTSPL
jgi:hypothetical protein